MFENFRKQIGINDIWLSVFMIILLVHIAVGSACFYLPTAVKNRLTSLQEQPLPFLQGISSAKTLSLNSRHL